MCQAMASGMRDTEVLRLVPTFPWRFLSGGPDFGPDLQGSSAEVVVLIPAGQLLPCADIHVAEVATSVLMWEMFEGGMGLLS